MHRWQGAADRFSLFASPPPAFPEQGRNLRATKVRVFWRPTPFPRQTRPNCKLNPASTRGATTCCAESAQIGFWAAHAQKPPPSLKKSPATIAAFARSSPPRGGGKNLIRVHLAIHAENGAHCVLQAFGSPRDAKGAVVVPSAMGVAQNFYARFAEWLAGQGYFVVTFDYRGIGRSAPATLRGFRADIFDWARDCESVIDFVKRRWPRTPLYWVGHSLGGQLACCRLALAPRSAQALWLVASGAPYWRSFPSPTRWWLPFAYRFLPWLAERRGALPGRRVGFGGNEARGVIRDWSRSALGGRYAAAGMDFDFERGFAAVD